MAASSLEYNMQQHRTSAQGLAQRHLAHALRVGGQLRIQERQLQRGEADRGRHAGAGQRTRAGLRSSTAALSL